MAEPDHLVISMEKMMSEVQIVPKREKTSTIYKVLKSVREEDPGSYSPQLISIGPYHHDNSNSALLPMQQLKWVFLRDLVDRHPENSIDKYVKKVRSLEEDARRCYSMPVVPNSDARSLEEDARGCYSVPVVRNSDAFVEMMVLDGCFIIEFLLKLNFGEDLHFSENWYLSLLKNDLLLLENQIPFAVLECLFRLTVVPGLDVKEGEEVLPIHLIDLALGYVTNRSDISIPDEVHHLLHLFHSSFQPSVPDPRPIHGCWSVMKRIMKQMKHIISYSFFFVMSLLFLVLSLIFRCRRPLLNKRGERAPRTIPSATQLFEAGVKFQLKKDSMSLLDVSFRIRDGIMEIPLLAVQAATISQFRNLVAFEQCCPTVGNHFTSYAALMDNLIDTPEDVALLDRTDILESKLGGDEEVSQFFDSLVKGSYLDYEEQHFVGVFKDVKEYSAKKSHRWRAKMMHDYFNNPWSAISLAAAVVLLVLTLAQTVLSFLSYLSPIR